MDSRPERYVPDAEEAWKAAFEWSDNEFYCDADTILSCGDAPVAEPDGDRDGGWLLGFCFLREAPERAIGTDRRAGKWGLRGKRGLREKLKR